MDGLPLSCRPRKKSSRFRLRPNGSVLLDVYSLTAFNRHEESSSYGINLLDGFWSPEKYYGFRNVFKYDDDKVVLDKYTIVEPLRTRTVTNWLQHFSAESLRHEFKEAGFHNITLYGDVAGAPFDETAEEFAIVGKNYD